MGVDGGGMETNVWPRGESFEYEDLTGARIAVVVGIGETRRGDSGRSKTTFSSGLLGNPQLLDFHAPLSPFSLFEETSWKASA